MKRFWLAATVAFSACGGGVGTPDAGGTTTGGLGFTLTVSSVAPSSGPLAGGTAVTVTGNGFGSGLSLAFGGAKASNVAITSPTTATAVTPAGADAGAVALTATLLGDTATLPDAFTYLVPPPQIGYCAVHFPTTLSVDTGQTAGPVYGWVYVPGVTDQGTSQGPGITAQLGEGPLDSPPGAGWTWTPATWDAKQGTGDHDDEYEATLPAQTEAGTFSYAFRFAVGDAGFVDCDTTGDATYNPSGAGILTVTAPAAPHIGFCAVHFPTTLAVDVGQTAGPVYGWVYAAGITDQGPDAGPGITGELGEGPLGSTPDEAWAWIPADWDAKQGTDGHNDEYEATLPAQASAGAFAYAYRFALADGGYVNCDTAGDATYAAALQGVLTVSTVVPPSIGYCAVHAPTALSVDVGQTAGPVYGWVYAAGVTDQGTSPGPGISAELGQGPTGSYPEDAGWSWVAAAWDAKQGPDGHNDEYNATLPAEDDAGTFAYAFRFWLADSGYVGCDAAGDATYNPVNAGVLTVAPDPGAQISYCAVHFPATLAVDVGQTAGPVYGWVYAAGVTDQGPDAGAGITAELGEGPTGSLPDAGGWTWVGAAWDAKQGPGDHNDEYNALLPAQSAPGTFAYAFRFSLTDAGFVDCDTAGDAAYTPANAGQLTVGLRPDAGADGGADAGPDAGPLDAGLADGGVTTIGYCNFAAPATLLGEAFSQTTPVYADVYAAGVTPGAGQGPGIAGAVGFGPLGSDPGDEDAGWTWFASAYLRDLDGVTPGGLANDQYDGTLTLPDAGTYAMAARFGLDGGMYRTCDLAGDGTYTPANQAVLTVVPAPLTVAWCDLQFPAALTASGGQDAGLVYGQVYQPGVTDDAGQGGDIWAQLGIGPAAADPTLPDSGFVWATATYDADRGSNDEYAAALVTPSDTGTYAYYFRFSEDDGNVWTVCGYLNPIALGGDAGVLTVE